MIKDLASLLAPVSEQSFLEHFREKKRLYVKSNDPARAISLFPWSEINRLIEADVLPPHRFRVIRSGNDLLPATYRDNDAAHRLRPRALQSLLSQGASVIINAVETLVPQIAYLCDAMERQLGHRSWANAYLSFGRGSAFKRHCDMMDVMVLQVHGTKLWRGYGTPLPHPVAQHNAGKDHSGRAVVWEQRLEAGDLLYLPRGEVHEASVEGSSSVHLTFGVEPPTAVDFIIWLASQAARDELVRMDLTHLTGENAFRAHEADLKKRLHAFVDAVSVDDFLSSDDSKRKPRALLSVGLIENLDGETMVVPTLRRRIALPAANEPEPKLVIDGESYRLSAAGIEVLHLLFKRNGLSFGAIVAALGGRTDERTLREAVVDLAKQGLVALAAPGGPGE